LAEFDPSYKFHNGMTWEELQKHTLLLSLAGVALLAGFFAVASFLAGLFESGVARPLTDSAIAAVKSSPHWQSVERAWASAVASIPIDRLASMCAPLIERVLAWAPYLAAGVAVIFHIGLTETLREEIHRLRPQSASANRAVTAQSLPNTVGIHQGNAERSREAGAALRTEPQRQGGTIMSSLIKLIANGPTYVILYILFMVPTYLLPYLGSNSTTLNAAGKASGAGLHPLFWLHLILLLILCVLAWARGNYVGKTWLVVFPILGLVFDLVPGLNFVPFVPTVMHLCAIIIGVSSQKVAT
jgi:hypothetical protein